MSHHAIASTLELRGGWNNDTLQRGGWPETPAWQIARSLAPTPVRRCPPGPSGYFYTRKAIGLGPNQNGKYGRKCTDDTNKKTHFFRGKLPDVLPERLRVGKLNKEHPSYFCPIGILVMLTRKVGSPRHKPDDFGASSIIAWSCSPSTDTKKGPQTLLMN